MNIIMSIIFGVLVGLAVAAVMGYWLMSLAS